MVSTNRNFYKSCAHIFVLLFCAVETSLKPSPMCKSSFTLSQQWRNFHYFDVVMKWVLHPIVMATEKKGIMETDCSVPTVTTMEKLSLPSQYERAFKRKSVICWAHKCVKSTWIAHSFDIEILVFFFKHTVWPYYLPRFGSKFLLVFRLLY